MTVTDQSSQMDAATLIERFVRHGLENAFCCLPARVETYYPQEGTADVQPLLREVQNEANERKIYTIPVLPHVPVAPMRLGGFVIRAPLKKGDRVLVQFADRKLDEWWLGDGGLKDPTGDPLPHSINNGIILPLSLSPRSDTIPNLDEDALVIGREDGSGSIKVFPDGSIELGSDGAEKRGVARLNDQVKSTAAEDPQFWAWVAAVHAFITSAVSGPALPLASSAYSQGFATPPSQKAGKITEASEKTKTE